ncbi:serine/threonine-protein kinase [Corallococcus exiguus]|uniref:serine/threonine-protein kinase n=1 Tax=Corallococcus exiguus TaxID=83462 RepID=UPI003DA5B951
MKISLPTRNDKGKTGQKARPTFPVDSLLGTRLGEFTLEECIGEGGMGVVYRAVHPLIGKQVAIKVLRSEMVSEHLVNRLLMEARAVNSIKHPGVVDIFGFGNLPDERPYVTMELLQGRPLSDFLRGSRPMELECVVWVMDQVLAALGAAHRAGVIHRDLKPANIFIVTDAVTAPVVKLVDFGIAKLLESRENPMTSEGTVLGTPEFMAPEQIRGTRISPATDLYALGVLMFQMLTGSRPFQGDPIQVMFAHMERPAPLPSSRVPRIPPTLDALVRHLLEKNPAARPHSAEAVRERLKNIPLRTTPYVPSVPTGTPGASDDPPSDDTLTSETLEPLKSNWDISVPDWWMAPVVLFLCTGAAVLRLQSTEVSSQADLPVRTAKVIVFPPPQPEPIPPAQPLKSLSNAWARVSIITKPFAASDNPPEVLMSQSEQLRTRVLAWSVTTLSPRPQDTHFSLTLSFTRAASTRAHQELTDAPVTWEAQLNQELILQPRSAPPDDAMAKQPVLQSGVQTKRPQKPSHPDNPMSARFPPPPGEDRALATVVATPTPDMASFVVAEPFSLPEPALAYEALEQTDSPQSPTRPTTYEQVVRMLEQLASELRVRASTRDVSELESQLQQFRIEAEVDGKTSDKRMALLIKMDAWLENLKTRFPIESERGAGSQTRP